MQASVSKEYQIKAAFLFNFTKFVEWPPQRFASDFSPIVIGILGHNPFDDELDKIVAGRLVNGRTIVVRGLNSAAEAKDVHLVFVSAEDQKQLGALTESLRASGTIIVSEANAVSHGGGVITFTLEGDKVRFEIDQSAAENAGVKISAQLLKLATLVHKKH